MTSSEGCPRRRSEDLLLRRFNSSFLRMHSFNTPPYYM